MGAVQTAPKLHCKMPEDEDRQFENNDAKRESDIGSYPSGTPRALKLSRTSTTAVLKHVLLHYLPLPELSKPESTPHTKLQPKPKRNLKWRVYRLGLGLGVLCIMTAA